MACGHLSWPLAKCTYFPVPISLWILPGSARYWFDPPHSGGGGPAVPGLRWQPGREGQSKQPPVWGGSPRLYLHVQTTDLCRPLKYFPTWPSLPASSGASPGSLLAPVVHDSAASDPVLPDRWRNPYPPPGESRSLPLPHLAAHPDPGLALGAQENDPEADPALPPAPVWQGGQFTPRWDQPRVGAALSQRPTSVTRERWTLPGLKGCHGKPTFGAQVETVVFCHIFLPLIFTEVLSQDVWFFVNQSKSTLLCLI